MKIEEFLWDEVNESKVEANGVSADDLDAMLEGRIGIFRNRNERTGEYLVVGRGKGRWLTASVEQIPGVPGLWRPVTAWPSKKGEITLAQQQGVGE